MASTTRVFSSIKITQSSRITSRHQQQRRTILCQAHHESKGAIPVVSRRQLEVMTAAVLAGLTVAPAAQALGFQKELKKRKISPDEYTELPATPALRIYELAPGRGEPIKSGATVTVHYDCLFKGIDVVSSRSARLLGGNRTIAEPFTFIVGGPVSGREFRMLDEGANGLFAGGSGPTPPPALSTAVIGMQVGGKRSILVPPELGYGDKGEQEIGPGQSFELQVEVLDVA